VTNWASRGFDSVVRARQRAFGLRKHLPERT